MRNVPIGKVAEVNPTAPKDLAAIPNVPTTFIPMAAVSEEGQIVDPEVRPVEEVLKGYRYFEQGDVLVAKITPCMENGKAAITNNIPHRIGFGSTEFHVLRPTCEVDGRYLFYMVWNPIFRRIAERNMTGTAGQKRVPTDFIKRYQIPLPSPSEQRRIAIILDKADAIRRKRQEALALTDEFLRSAFLEMFGDPVTNPKGWKDVPLHKAARFVSGGTPSKENKKYWEGEFPWVSPKDMKTIEILDSADHVHETVFEETSLSKIPENAILIVVRGMILAHTVPLAIARRPITINQDMKALLFKDEIIPEFALWAIRVQHDHLLTKVSTAAHGTKRFDMQDLEAICIPVPEPQLQRTFQSISRKFLSITDQYKTSTQSFNNLFHSLTQRAFRGEL